MDEYAYPEGQNFKRKYEKGLTSRKYQGKDERKSLKMVWTCAKTRY